MYSLRLFVSGTTPRSERAVENLQAMLSRLPVSEYELEVIDVLEAPEQAECEGLLATPTLIKREPPPVRRIVGDLSDRERVMTVLSLLPPSE